ncbi:MAG: urate hydroxylase PuuD [Xanthomonadales bacterium]
MEAYLQEWLSLLLRWAHFITGVAWIGASFYFNWLENHLERQNAQGGIAGDLWAVHGGGFYYLQKFQVAPERLPATLHWFKWEAYFTWLTGFSLLCTLYYWNAGVYMVDSRVADLSSLQAVAVGIASLVLSWLFYDGLCRSPLAKKQALTALLIFAWFALLSWLLSQYLSGRAAYMHVGAAIGTIMVANVLFVIIPSQKDLVEAVSEQRMPDPQKGENALARSRHNNYFTLPVLFIMISSHYAGTFGHPQNWLVLLVISTVGVGIRHWFNIRHLEKHSRLWLPLSLLLLAALIFAMRPESKPDLADTNAFPSTADIMPVLQVRCVTCHAARPDHPGFAAAPSGILLDREEAVDLQALIIFNAVNVTQSMPLANATQMSDEERNLIARWYAGRMRSKN